MRQQLPPNWVNYFDQQMLLLAAFRYFVGRETGAANSFANGLAAAWPILPDSDREIMRYELTDAFRRDDEAREEGKQWKPLGADCDRKAWEQVRKAWIAYEATKQMR